MVNFENGVTPINDTNLNKLQEDLATEINKKITKVQRLSSIDLDTLIEQGTGLFSVLSVTANAPTDVSPSHFFVTQIVTIETSASYAMQIASHFFNDILYFRRFNGSSWTAWKSITLS